MATDLGTLVMLVLVAKVNVFRLHIYAFNLLRKLDVICQIPRQDIL